MARDELRRVRAARGESHFRWWAKLGGIAAASLAACGLITFGALRVLDEADRQHDKIECIRVQVQAQAKGTATMAMVVLDQRRPQVERAQAVADWRDDQARVAESIGRC